MLLQLASERVFVITASSLVTVEEAKLLVLVLRPWTGTCIWSPVNAIKHQLLCCERLGGVQL